MNKIKCKTDEVFTTSDGKEHTDKGTALSLQKLLNFNASWEYNWTEGMDRIRYTPAALAYYGTGSKAIRPNEYAVRNYIYENKDMIKEMIESIEKVEIEYETK